PAPGHDVAHLDQGLVQQRHRLCEIDDMNVVASAEDERSHLRIPAVALVAEVTAGLEQLTHIEGGKRHGCKVLFRLNRRGTREKTVFCAKAKGRPTGALGGAFGPPSAGPACGMGAV